MKAKESKENFSHVIDVIQYSGKLPVEIIPDHHFRKARMDEIERIKRELNPLQWHRYELKSIAGEKEGTSHTVNLPPEEWRYYVIACTGYNDRLMDIEYAANFIEHNLTIGYTFFRDEKHDSGMMYNPRITHTAFIDQYIFSQYEKNLDSGELNEITVNYNLITELDKLKYDNIYRAVKDFHFSKMITDISDLKVLSYVSIIECLLTHPPRPIDTIDSLTRQVRTKMNLLSKIFQRNLDQSKYFPAYSDSDKLWGKLYAYRSAIAHGGNPDFTKDFKVLINRNTIQAFLFESVKLLILFALKEPEFITDLQKC
jgi:hypothetical protein